MNKDLLKALLPNQADFTVSTLVVSGEKNLSQQFCLQHQTKGSRSCPTSYTIKTCLGPHWKHMWDKILQKPSGLSILGWIAALLLKHFSSFSAVLCSEFLSHRFLLQLFSSDVFCVLWFGQYLYFYWHAILFSPALSKFPDFQAEGVMSRGVK